MRPLTLMPCLVRSSIFFGLLVISRIDLTFSAREHVRGDAVVALVVAEAERQVGVDGVEAVVLQPVRADLVDQADAAALLAQVEHDALVHLADRSSEASSWSRQSQRSEPSTSPVRHSECTRTGTSSAPITSPCTSATCSLPSRLF